MFIIVARAMRPALYHDRYLSEVPLAGGEPIWHIYPELARKFATKEEADKVRGRIPKDTAPNHYDYEVEEA